MAARVHLPLDAPSRKIPVTQSNQNGDWIRSCDRGDSAPAIDGNGRSVHTASALRGQKCGHRGKLLGRSNAARGNLTSPAGEDPIWFDVRPRGNTFRETVEACRARIPWAGVVYGDAVGRIFIRWRARQSGFRGAPKGAHTVGHKQPIHRLLHRRRSHGDESSRIVFPPTRQRLARKEIVLIGSWSRPSRPKSILP